ncbi:MAG TPA: chromate transporter [Clostridiales bacterium]|nr:chromate transporter [Clostridiales bacterium]
MRDLILLCLRFFQTGLLAAGGGLATLPFLSDMAADHPEWFTRADLATIVAVSESTPGPIGINMATFAGFKTHGVLGALCSTFSLVLPSFIVILIIYKLLEKFKNSKTVDHVFRGLRPASTGLIAAAALSLFFLALFPDFSGDLLHDAAGIRGTFNLTNTLCFLGLFVCTQIPKIKDLHPILFILAGAGLGLLLQL